VCVDTHSEVHLWGHIFDNRRNGALA
jgi:hypothetical protein